MSLPPLHLADIRKDVRRVGALLQRSLPEIQPIKARCRPSNRSRSEQVRCSRLDDGQHAHHARNYLREGIEQTRGRYPLLNTPPHLRDRPVKEAPRPGHHNTPEPGVLDDLINADTHDGDSIHAYENKVKRTDIDYFPYVQLETSRSMDVNTGLPSIHDNDSVVRPSSARSRVSVTLPRDGGAERLPPIASSQEGHLRYKHGLTQPKRRRWSPSDEDGSSRRSHPRSAWDEDAINEEEEDESDEELESLTASSGWDLGRCDECQRINHIHESWCSHHNVGTTSSQLTSARKPSKTPLTSSLANPDRPSRRRMVNFADATRATPESYLERSEKIDSFPSSGTFVKQSVTRAGLSPGKLGPIPGKSRPPPIKISSPPPLDTDPQSLTLFMDGAKEAYMKALNFAQASRMPSEYWMFGSQISRAFVFSYFNKLPNIPSDPLQSDPPVPSPRTSLQSPRVPKGKEMKHIFGNLNVNDFFPGGKRNLLSEEHMKKAVVRDVNKDNSKKMTLSVDTGVNERTGKERLSANSQLSKDSGFDTEKSAYSVPSSPRTKEEEIKDGPMTAR